MAQRSIGEEARGIGLEQRAGALVDPLADAAARDRADGLVSLERLDLHAHRRLGEVELLRGARERAGAVDGEERAEQVQVGHVGRLQSRYITSLWYCT